MKTRRFLTAALSVFTAFAMAVTAFAAPVTDIAPEAAVSDGVDKSVTLYKSRTDSVTLDSSYSLAGAAEVLYTDDTLHIIAQVTTDVTDDQVIVSITGNAADFDDDASVTQKTIDVDTNGCVHVALYASAKGTSTVSFLLASNPLVKSTITVSVVDPTDVKSITLVPEKMVTDYYLGELNTIDDMDFGGAYLIATCYDDSTYNVDIESGVHPTAPDVRTIYITSDFKGDTVNVDVIGTQDIYFVYEGCFAPFTIDIKMDYVTGIKIKTLPYKLEYNIGDRYLDLDGGTLEVTHRNGRVEEINMSAASYSGFDTSSSGEKVITLTYKNKSTSFTIAVLSNSVEKIEVHNAPSYCYKGNTLNFSSAGTYIHVTYSNGSTRDIYIYGLSAREGTSGAGTIYENSGNESVRGITVSGYDKNVPGKYTVLVEYGGASDRFVAEVKDVEPVSIEIIKDDPGKTDYYEGEELDLDGFRVMVNYSNGDSDELDLKPLPDGLTVSEYRKNLIGTQLIFFNYKGLSAQIFVTVHKIVVEELELTKTPDKTEYLIGEDLDLTGGVLTAKLESGDTKVISTDSEDVTASGYSSIMLGDQTVTLTYKNKSVEYTVNVDRLKVTRLELSPAPTKRVYKIGETLDLTGGKVYIYYNNNTHAVLDCDDALLARSGFDSSSAGTKTITFAFGGETVSYDVTVSASAVARIAVTTLPKTAYQTGEVLDVTGGIITVTYEDGSTAAVTMTADMVTGFSSASAGAKLLTVNYGGSTATYTVTVAASGKTAVSIAVTTLPKTVYQVGDALDVAGGIITVTYSDGTTSPVAMTASMISGFSSASAGTKTLTVTYSNCTATYPIIVSASARTAVSIAVTTYPKTSYQVGDALDVSGGILTVTYNDGTSSPVAMTTSMISGFSSLSAGTRTLTVTYSNCTTTYPITVAAAGKTAVSIAVTTSPKTSYQTGEALDVTGGIITVIYSDGTTDEVAMTTGMISGFSSSTAGPRTLTVNYSSLVTYYTITVSDTVTGKLEIISYPSKLRYYVGEALDVTGGMLKASFSSGGTEVVAFSDDGVTVSGFNTAGTGGKTLTVQYKGLSANYNISMYEKKAVSVYISAYPAKLTYSPGEALDLTGGVITASYIYGDEESIGMTDSRVFVSGFDSTTPGSKHIRLTVDDRSASFAVTVVDDTVKSVSVYKEPNKTSYFLGESLDLTGGVIKITYNGSADKYVNMTDKDVSASGFDSAVTGTKIITLTYALKQTTFTVSVVTDRITDLIVNRMPLKTIYRTGDTLDLSGGSLRVVYNNGARYDIIGMDDAGVTASYFSSATAGTKTVELGYAGLTASISVTVIPPDNVMIDNDGYDTLYEALAAITSAKKRGAAKSRYTVEINSDLYESKSLTFPDVPIVITSARGADVTITKLAVSTKASLTVDGVTFVTNKGKSVNFTVKGDFAATGCTTGNINATGSVALDDVNVDGKIISGTRCTVEDSTVRDTVYSKGVAVLTRTAVGKTVSITATSGISSLTDCTVGGKLTCASDLSITDCQSMADVVAKKGLTVSDSRCKSLNVKQLLTIDGNVVVTGAVTAAGIASANSYSVLSYTALSVTTNGMSGVYTLTLRVIDKYGNAVSLSPSSSKTNVVAKKFKGTFRNTMLALSTDNYMGSATLTVKSNKLIIG